MRCFFVFSLPLTQLYNFINCDDPSLSQPYLMRLSMFSFVFLICARHCIRFSSWFFWRVCVCQYIFLNFQEFLWYYAQVVVTIWLKFRMVSLNRFLWPVCNTIMHKDIRQKFIVNFIYSFERNSYFSFLSFHSDFSIFSFHICWNFSPVKCDCSLSLYCKIFRLNRYH